MAQRVQVLLVDDLDTTSSADETVTFALDGVTYEIDLASENAARLREDLAPWIGHARRSTTRKASARGSAGKKRKDQSEIREWARRSGHKVSDRGRISAEVQAAYDKAHS